MKNPMTPQEETNQEHLAHEETVSIHPVAAQKRGYWEKVGGGSLSVAIGLHLVLAIIAIYLIAQQYTIRPKPDFDITRKGGPGGGERSAESTIRNKKLAVITPTSNVKRAFAEGAVSNFSIPVQGDDFGQMSVLTSLTASGSSSGSGAAGSNGSLGNGDGLGDGLGKFGQSKAKIFKLLPPPLQKRCSQSDREARLAQNGGTPECEVAVQKGLMWLKSQQQPDGSFSRGSYSVAMTGLTLLAYFGHCETPLSEEYGESSMKAIVFLVNRAMQNNGKMATEYSGHAWVYEHAICTYALAEAYTFCKQMTVDIPNLKEMTEKAGMHILQNQNANGGWAYEYAVSGGHTDVSVTGWHVQALKALSHTGIKFPGIEGTVTSALEYMNKCQMADGGYGYTGPSAEGRSYFALTGVGVLANQMWSKNPGQVKKGADYIKTHTKFNYNGSDSDLYAHYYESQAMMQMGGEYWKSYNSIFMDQVLKNQNEDGSWKMPGGGQKINAIAHNFQMEVYRTALCTLMLEVYYRFLNSSGGGMKLRDRAL